MMPNQYTPPKVWSMKQDEQTLSSLNRPTAGARSQQLLPQGQHPFQLYSLATPNGVKVTIMFEELLQRGICDAEYDAYLIDIGKGEQFGSDFVEVNPNSKIPALIDNSGDTPIYLFESGSILLHLAEKFNQFLPHTLEDRVKTLNWLFWQVGSGPFVGGGFGHFYSYAPDKIEYAIDRYAMESKRQLDVLNTQLSNNKYIIGDEYTIADMAIFPWYGALVLGKLYGAAEFLSVQDYSHVLRWANELLQRPGVQRGRMVNRNWGDSNMQVPERHGPDDFITTS